jgi:hypothetical protein
VISTGIEVISGLISHVVLHVAFVELTIGEKNLDKAVSNFPIFKACFDHLVRRTEQKTHTRWFIIAPSTSVIATIWESASTVAISDIILKVTLEDFSIAENDLSLTVFIALCDSTFINSAHNIFEFKLYFF